MIPPPVATQAQPEREGKWKREGRLKIEAGLAECAAAAV